MALFLIADIRSHGLARLDIRDIDSDGGAVAMGTHRFVIPVGVWAALAEFTDGTTRDALVDSFKWPLARVERALAALEIRLRPTGRTLRQIGWHRYALGPNLAILSSDERTQLVRSAGPESLDRRKPKPSTGSCTATGSSAV